MNPKPDFLALLKALQESRVDFIVVGGVCAVLQGAPINTFDLDVVHSREPDNIDRLLVALEGLDVYYRGKGERRIKPERSHLCSPGHQLLTTRFGPLDLLGEIGQGHGYEELLTQTVELDVGGDVKARVLNLDTLIKIKEETAREKDQATLAILKRTLEERSKGEVRSR
jgi:predicted nucleotidyltransferase